MVLLVTVTSSLALWIFLDKIKKSIRNLSFKKEEPMSNIKETKISSTKDFYCALSQIEGFEDYLIYYEGRKQNK